MRSYLVATAVLVATQLAKADGPLPDHAKHSIKTDIPLAVQARLAAERVIPYLEKDGTAWINDRKCLTCPQVSTMWCVLALGTLDQPNEKQTASRDKALEWLRKTSPDGKYAATSSE